jgi:hypothetical protein
MSTKSGKDGKVLIGATPLASITHWRLRTTSRNPAHASSATGGAKTRNPGVKDSSGVIRFKLDFADPITDSFDEGDQVTLLLYLDDARHYTAPAIIDAIELDEVDIDDGAVIGGTAWFSGTGPVTKPTYE